MKVAIRLILLASSAAAVVVAWSGTRGYVARGIQQRVESQPATARVALGELAQLGAAGVEPLLDAAVSPDRSVADPARRYIEALLVRWAATRDKPLDKNYLRVVEGLLQREPRLTPSGRRWARTLAGTALRLAESTRESVDAELVRHAEQLFAAARGVSQRRDLPRPLPPNAAPPAAVSFAPRSEPQPPMLPPFELPTGEPVESLAMPDQSPALPTPAVTPEPPELIIAPELPREPARLPDGLAAAPTAEAAGPPGLNWRKPHGVDAQQAPHADGAGDTPEEGALPREVESLLKGSNADKLQLIEELLSGQHHDAPTLLWQLAKDPSAKVRASAISALGSSSNRQLTQAAWRLALNDEDPQVARLAQELQKLLR